MTAMTDHPEALLKSTRELMFSRPGFLIRRLNQINAGMYWEEFLPSNITPVQYGMLTIVARLPGLDQTRLGQEIGLDRTTTADVVKRLEQRGLLRRSPNPADRRSRLVNPTPEGQEAVAGLEERLLRAQERLLGPLRPAERAILMDLMRRLVETHNQCSRTAMRDIY